jgi:hypothetical protein
MSVEEFYFIIDNIFVATKDGHTHMDDPIQTIVDLPSYVWTSDGLIINHNKGPFKKGDRILKIGGKTDTELLNMFKTIIPAEHDGFVNILQTIK